MVMRNSTAISFLNPSLPFLMYNCAGLTLTNEQVRKLNVCWNNVYHEVFAMKQWESVKCVQFYCG